MTHKKEHSVNNRLHIEQIEHTKKGGNVTCQRVYRSQTVTHRHALKR